MFRNRFVVLGLMLLALALIWVFIGIRSLIRDSYLAPFKQHLTEYLAPPTEQVAEGTPGYFRGRAICVDPERGEIDWLYFALPEDMQAKHPDEVSTIVLLKWDMIRVRRYTNGGIGYRQTCRVTVIDRATRQAVAEADFEGGPPPATSRNPRITTGDKPITAIVGFLRELPRK